MPFSKFVKLCRSVTPESSIFGKFAVILIFPLKNLQFAMPPSDAKHWQHSSDVVAFIPVLTLDVILLLNTAANVSQRPRNTRSQIFKMISQIFE